MIRSLSFDNLSAAQAAGTDFKGGFCVSDHGTHFDQVGLPGSAGPVLGVAHVVAVHRPAARNLTILAHFLLTNP